MAGPGIIELTELYGVSREGWLTMSANACCLSNIVVGTHTIDAWIRLELQAAMTL